MTLPPRVYCDTSFFYAALDSSDVNHPRAAELAAWAAASNTDFVTTWDVVSETATLLRYRLSFRAAWLFLSEIKPRLQLVEYGDELRAEAEDIFRIHGRDHRLSLCDAVSFVVVTTLLDNAPAFAFDRDFIRLGLTVLN